MGKLAIVILSGSENPVRAMTGIHVAQRIFDAREANQVEAVEVFLFGEGLRMLGDRDQDLGTMLRELTEAGIAVGGCTNQLTSWNLLTPAEAAGVRAEFARDAFARYARDGFTVITF